ncbi:MAG: beta-ketoacyl-ACP synthase II, partial [Psittacicella sp.]
IQYGIAATQQAVSDANLDFKSLDRTRIGVAIGSGIGGIEIIEKNHSALIQSGPKKVSPFFVPATIVNMLAGTISIQYKLYGPNIAISTACTSALHNLGHAARMISYGDADIMIAGGAEKASTALGIAGFGAAKALSTHNDKPEEASRPWDDARDGFVLGDGAGILILEEYEHAIKRNAKIYAEIAGFGMSGDGHHMTSPPEDGFGGALAMKNSLKDANISPEKIGYINAHGTSTPLGDYAEANAISSIFDKDKVLVSSTKSMTGHLLGAAGAIESIFTILSLKDQIVPPTINLVNQDTRVNLNLVPNKSIKTQNMKYALCNSFGFGGTNGSIIFKLVE